MYSFKLNYSHGLVSVITNLSTFLLTTLKALSAGLAKSLLLKKCFCFYQEIYLLVFSHQYACKVWKDGISIIHGKTIILLIKLGSFQSPRSVFSRLQISMVLMEVFVVSCKWNFFLGIFSSSW